jgi:hypothetical protein
MRELVLRRWEEALTLPPPPPPSASPDAAAAASATDTPTDATVAPIKAPVNAPVKEAEKAAAGAVTAGAMRRAAVVPTEEPESRSVRSVCLLVLMGLLSVAMLLVFLLPVFKALSGPTPAPRVPWRAA